MRTIGLLGGTNWTETARYYRLAKEIVRVRDEARGTRLFLDWVDDHELEYLQVTVEWDAAAAMLVERAQSMREAGVQAMILCGSLHAEVSWRVLRELDIPVVALHEAATYADVEAALLQVLTLQRADGPAPTAS
jgi:aspartate racemase